MVAGRILHGAHRLDAWLKIAVGRPYNIILGVGLVYGIIGSIQNLIHAAGETHILTLIGTTIFQLALLLNQLGQLHEHREAVRERRAARRSRRRSRGAED